jgi:hypothetical protein
METEEQKPIIQMTHILRLQGRKEGKPTSSPLNRKKQKRTKTRPDR